MNKNGWGLRVELAIIILFLICLVIATIGISKFGLLRNNDDNSLIIVDTKDDFVYSTVENKLKDAASLYFKDRYNSTTNDTLVVSASTLISNGYLNNLVDGNNRKCNGYVRILTNGVIVSYINCPRYKTSGYDKNNE